MVAKRPLIGLEAQNGPEPEGDGIERRMSAEPGGRGRRQFEELSRPRGVVETDENLARPEPRDLGHERAIEVQKAAGGRDGVEKRGTVLEPLLENREMKSAPRVIDGDSEESAISLADERGRIGGGKPPHEIEKMGTQRGLSDPDLRGVLFRALRTEAHEERREKMKVPPARPSRDGRSVSGFARRDPVVVALGSPFVHNRERCSREEPANVLR